MSDRDVYLDDMGLLFDTAELDRVLAGRALPDDAPIARFVDDMRETFPSSPVSPEVEARQLMAIVAAANEPIASAPAVPSRLERLRSSVAARVGALTLAAGSGLTGAAAYAGVLPDEVQGVVSDAAASVGVELPHPDDVADAQVADEATDERVEDASDEGRQGGPASDTAGSEGSTRGADDGSGGDRRSAGTSDDDKESREDETSDDDGDGRLHDEQATGEDSERSDREDDDSSDSDGEASADDGDDEADDVDDVDDAGDETETSDRGAETDDADDVGDDDGSDGETSGDSDFEGEGSGDSDMRSEDLESDLED